MKKNYIKPEMKVYEMEPQQLLAASEEPKLHEEYPDNEDIW